MKRVKKEAGEGVSVKVGGVAMTVPVFDIMILPAATAVRFAFEN